MDNSIIDEIKNRLDIVDVIGSYIKLQKAGVNYRAPCPFHSEKKPSFFVSPTRQIWHCFGACGEGGDIFKFVMKIEGIEFGDALRILAQRAGVELKKEKPELRTKREKLYEICDLSCLFFERQLWESARGRMMLKYLLNRGFNEESIKNWRIGYSPDNWSSLTDFLISKGYKKEDIEKAGLLIKNEQGSYYDRFRGRIMFPVFDINSQVVGFGGRVSPDKEKEEVAKYINTPSTLIYDKSKILYGLNFSKGNIRKKDSSILVEGYVDAILLFQAGFDNVVSSSGTALTVDQLRILKRYSDNLMTAFDMDFAGDSATKRGIDLAQSMGFNIKIITMPEELDPADIVVKDSSFFGKLIENSKNIYEFYFDTTFSKFNYKDPKDKKIIANILLPLLKRIPNKIEQSFWIQKLSQMLEARESDVWEELEKVKISRDEYLYEPEKMVVSPEYSKKSRKDLLEERLLAITLKFPNLVENLSSQEKDLLETIRKNAFSNQDYLNYLYLLSEKDDLSEKDAFYEAEFCVKEIILLGIKEKLENISNDIRKAENENDFKKIEQLIQEFNYLSKKIQLS